MPFKVLAFPDNQYFAQEPGTNAEIAKYVEGSGTHTYPGHPKATWSGTVVPPTILFAKTRGFSGKVPKPPVWAPGLKGEWCNVTTASACSPSSSECCAKNEAVWKHIASLCTSAPGGQGCSSTSYPPSWNFAGKYIFDKCGKLREAVGGNSPAAPWSPIKASVEALLKESADKCK